MIEKKALLGFHDERDLGLIREMFRQKEYSVSKVQTPIEMRRRVADTQYGWYVMDANLGYSASENFGTALKVQKAIDQRVQEKNAKFFCLAYDWDVIKAAREQGLPALRKDHFNNLFWRYHETLSSGTFKEILAIISDW
jgi:hypothetical protein